MLIRTYCGTCCKQKMPAFNVETASLSEARMLTMHESTDGWLTQNTLMELVDVMCCTQEETQRHWFDGDKGRVKIGLD